MRLSIAAPTRQLINGLWRVVFQLRSLGAWALVTVRTGREGLRRLVLHTLSLDPLVPREQGTERGWSS